VRHSFCLYVLSDIFDGDIGHVVVQYLLFKSRHIAVIAIDALIHQVIWKQLLVKHTVSGRVDSIESRRVPKKSSSTKDHVCPYAPYVHIILSSGCELTVFDERQDPLCMNI
jgi:hypothetical protein